MNPANLTRQEVGVRSAAVSTQSYRVSVDLTGQGLDNPEETFTSTSVVQFSSNGDDTWIDLIADKVLKASLDGNDIDPSTFKNSRLPLTLSAGEHELSVTALCRYSHSGEGLHRFVDPADGNTYLYTQFESADARRMYACFEQPDLKAHFQLSVRAPHDWAVISNSPTPTPSAADKDGMCVWDFEPTEPISTYITALIAGQYYVDEGTVQSVKGELGANIVCRQSMVPYLDAERIRTTTQRGFEVYEEDFGLPYPFAKYDQLFVPEYNAGAMENAGAVTIRDEYLFRSRVTSAQYETRDNTILHELAHMWFGDLVTMRWWDDLWLNESFAEWASHYCQEQIVLKYGGTNPWIAFANSRKTWAYNADQLPTTHPIAADMVDLEAVEQNFDGITYAKGASVLKQLVAFVGEENFLAGVRQYLSDHSYSNAQFADLLDALNKASSSDLSDFAQQWLSTSGVNTLSVDAETDDDGVFTRFEIVQTGDGDDPQLRQHHLGIGFYNLKDQELVRSDFFEVDVHDERTPIAVLVGQARPDVVLLNDQDLSFAKIRLDPQSLNTALNGIDQFADPLARSLVWNCAWDMTRDAQLPASEYLALVSRGVSVETDMTGVRMVLAQARTAATSYTAASGRDQARRYLVTSLARLLKNSQPGSEHELAFTDAMISAIHDDAGAELIEGWLDGEEVPSGVTIDQDRRWAILTSLARVGRITTDQIDAEAEQDKTISGAERAAGAKAALATEDAKEQAWKLATQAGNVPNATHLHICMEFVHYGQEELLAPYVDRYLEVCQQISDKQGIWASQGHAASQAVLSWLWPSPCVDRDFIGKLDEWMGSTTLSESVRHVLVERRDMSLRALAAQEFGARR